MQRSISTGRVPERENRLNKKIMTSPLYIAFALKCSYGHLILREAKTERGLVKEANLLFQHSCGEIQAIKWEVHKGVDLVTEAVGVGEALEVDDKDFWQIPKIQLLVRLHHLLAPLARPAL